MVTWAIIYYLKHSREHSRTDTEHIISVTIATDVIVIWIVSIWIIGNVVNAILSTYS
jgi:hypothetical protein